MEMINVVEPFLWLRNSLCLFFVFEDDSTDPVNRMCVWGMFQAAFVLKHSLTCPLFSLQIILPLTSWQRLSRAQHREQSFIASQGSTSQLWIPSRGAFKTDPDSLIKGLSLNSRLRLAPGYTICLFHFTRHKEPRTPTLLSGFSSSP